LPRPSIFPLAGFSDWDAILVSPNIHSLPPRGVIKLHLLSLLGWAACTLVAFGLSKILVTPPPVGENAEATSRSSLL